MSESSETKSPRKGSSIVERLKAIRVKQEAEAKPEVKPKVTDTAKVKSEVTKEPEVNLNNPEVTEAAKVKSEVTEEPEVTEQAKVKSEVTEVPKVKYEAIQPLEVIQGIIDQRFVDGVVAKAGRGQGQGHRGQGQRSFRGQRPTRGHSRSFRSEVDSTKLHQESIEAKKAPAKIFDLDLNPSKVDLKIFMKDNEPSKVKRSQGIGAVVIMAKGRSSQALVTFEEKLARGQKACEEWTKMTSEASELKPLDFEAICDLGAKFDLKGGKWMMHLQRRVVDDLFHKLGWALGTGVMPSGVVCLNVTPVDDLGHDSAQDKGIHVLSLWNGDFRDEETIFAVEKAVRQLGISNDMIYKPDVFSAIGVYRNNPWRIRPVIYTSKGGNIESGLDLSWKFPKTFVKKMEENVEKKRD